MKGIIITGTNMGRRSFKELLDNWSRARKKPITWLPKIWACTTQYRWTTSSTAIGENRNVSVSIRSRRPGVCFQRGSIMSLDKGKEDRQRKGSELKTFWNYYLSYHNKTKIFQKNQYNNSNTTKSRTSRDFGFPFRIASFLSNELPKIYNNSFKIVYKMGDKYNQGI